MSEKCGELLEKDSVVEGGGSRDRLRLLLRKHSGTRVVLLREWRKHLFQSLR